MLRTTYKRIKKKMVSHNHAVIIGGLGRCGTKVLVNAFSRAYFERMPFLNRFADEPNYRRGGMYKTHAYPPESLPDHARVIYLFGNPMDIAVSAHRKINDWGRKHFLHLEVADYPSNDSVLQGDSLQLEQHFDAWYQPQNFPMITLRYETLYKPHTRDALNQFMGFNVELPPFRQRKADWTAHPLRDTLAAVYGNLAEKIEAADDARIWD